MFEEKNVNGFWVGIIFASYSIAVVTVSPFIGKILSKVGFKNLIAFGLVAMGISIIPFGFFDQIESATSCICFGIALRILQGSSSASINSTVYSLAADLYPEETESMIGLLEAFSGVGGIIGLLGGASIFEVLG